MQHKGENRDKKDMKTAENKFEKDENNELK